MKSIRAKILALIGGVMIVAMVVSGLVVVNHVYNTVKADEREASALSSQELALQVDEQFAKYIAVVQTLADDWDSRKLITDSANREQFFESPYYPLSAKTLKAALDRDTEKNILMAYVVSAKADIAYDGTGWVVDPGFDLTTRPYWFADQKDVDKGYILTEPYVDINTGGMVVTISAPLYDTAGSEVVGIAAIDVTIDKLSSMVIKNQSIYGDKGVSVMFTGDGTTLASAEKDDLLKNLSETIGSEELQAEVLNPTGESVNYKYNGEEYYASVANIPHAGWRILLAVDKDTFLSDAQAILIKTIIVYVVAVIAIMILIVFVSGSISGPMRKLNLITQKLADGELETEVDVTSRDETGQLAESMRKLVERLNEYGDYIAEITENLNKLAAGHLNIRMEKSYDGEFATIKDAMMSMADALKDTIGQMIETSERVASGSGEIASAAQQLAQGATHQASTTEELTATINDLSEKVSKNAEDAMNASSQVRSVGDTADQSNAQMQEMIRAIQDINAKSSEIGNIIKTIEDIAFQTNILALNAAVEAARAGEAGKGFAVVADEVRNLASKSSEAAKDTTHLIEETIKAVENGTEIANKTGEMLGEVIDGVSQTVGLIEDISSASTEQAEALKQTLNGVEQITTVVQTNAATAEESSAASDELSRQAKDLQSIASRFKL